MRLREGTKMKCEICKKVIKGDIFWTIFRYEKEIKAFPCEKCGKLIRIDFDPESDLFEIQKGCKCTTRLSAEALRPFSPRWKKKGYSFCDECFKKAYGKIMFINLGEDKDE